MKYPFSPRITILICALLVACGQVSQIAPMASATSLPTDTAISSQITTSQLEVTPTIDINILPTLSFVMPDGTKIPFSTPNPKIPTLLPTIDPTSASDLLSKSITIQVLEGNNWHTIQKITGWDYGFRQSLCGSYQWLDANHLVLHPRTGEAMRPAMDSMVRGDLSSEPVVINLTSGNLWLRPWWSTPISDWDCNSDYWSRELGIIINQQEYGTTFGPVKEAVFTYTFDGQQVAEYWGKILGVSPSGEKILVDEDTIIDLRNNKVIDLAWHMNYDVGDSPRLYWSSDETRLYQCCFYYADLHTGESYNLEWNDLRGVDRKPISFTLKSPHIGRQWVRNDTYFFPMWDYMSYAGDPAMIFSPAEKKYYVIETSSPSTINPETQTYKISPDGMQVWITGYGYDGMYHSFLINLSNFESASYDIPVNDFFWSPDGKFGWMNVYDSGDKYVLSAATKTLIPLPIPGEGLSWRPNDHVLAFFTKEGLAILDAKDMSLKGWKLPSTFSSIIWSPDGNRIALLANDGSLWQVDYPKLQNFEQLTTPMSDVRNVFWSPDGNSIAFVSGSDIYIVDTTK